MITYRILRKYFPRWVALTGSVVFLLFLLALSVYYAYEPQAEFRYQEL